MEDENKIIINKLPSKTWYWLRVNETSLPWDEEHETVLPEENVEAVVIIGVTTFALSVFGVFVGNFFGTKYKKKAEIAGGIILILIGVKILLEHLGILNF